MYHWIQSSIWSNSFRSIVLVIFFPIILFFAVYLVFSLVWEDKALESTIYTFYIIWPVLIIWLLISFYFHKQLLFKFSWAKEITRKENPEIYNIVENLCISRWLKTPKIGIIEEKWMNAFAAWWNPENAWIVFTTGLLDSLEKKEIESVAAHELSHVINKDNLLMTVLVIFIWAISSIGYIILRSMIYSGWSNKWWKGKIIILLIWLMFIIIWSIIYPLMKLTISRKREYLADAWAVELTKDKYSMISALKKISKKANIELEDESMASMYIWDPIKKEKKSWFRKYFHNLFSTHPSIEDRIKALESY